MNNPPLALSIVIPVYNREQSIRQSIESILESPLTDIEVIVSDDGSTDNSLLEVSKIDDSRVRVMSAKHYNANHARLRGVEAAKSELIAFLDSDDLFLESRVEQIISYFNNNHDVDILVDSFIVNKQGNQQGISFDKTLVDNAHIQELLIAHAIPITFSSIAARREAIIKHQLIDESFRRHQDRDFLLNAINQNLTIKTNNAQGVMKFQVTDSFSRSHIGYISGLDALVCKHTCFSIRENRKILSYLIARTFIKSILHLNISALYYSATSLHRSKCLQKNLLGHLANYFPGKKRRKEISKQYL